MTAVQDAAVVANTAAISLEEVTPVGVSSSGTLAPEQVGNSDVTSASIAETLRLRSSSRGDSVTHVVQLHGKKKREDDLMGDGDVNRDERKRRRAKHKRIVSKTRGPCFL